jgi:hypothetical protein
VRRIQRHHALLEFVRWVHDARVGYSELLQIEQAAACSVFSKT